jgi:uncharacterized protein YmfQ (DUF2313 family)
MDARDYAQQLKQLLPPGPVWQTGIKDMPAASLTTTGTVADPLRGRFRRESRLGQVLGALAVELARVEQRARDLVEESDPRTATETLDQWEAMLGLPDDAVLEIPATTEKRRLAILAKIRASLGGQSVVFFEELALVCGYVAVVVDGYASSIPRSGRYESGAPVYGVAWAHAWKMVVQPPAGVALSTDELERIIRRAAPAHTVVIFEFV